MASAAVEGIVSSNLHANNEELVEVDDDATPELLESILNAGDEEVLERIQDGDKDEDDLDDSLGDIDKLLEETRASRSAEKRSPLKADVRVRPPVVDDFIRNFFIKNGLKRSLDAFQNEWYSLQLSGKLNATAMEEAVPDLYMRNQQLLDIIRAQEVEMKKLRTVAENAKSFFDKLRQQRDFHRMHHRRVVQEKEKLISDFKRLRRHYEQYEPTLTELRHKYEVAMKEKFLLKLERDKYLARASGLEEQLANSEITNSAQDESRDAPVTPPAAAPETATSSGATVRKAGDSPWPTEVTDLRLARTFKAHDDGLCKVALHPKVPMVATTSDDCTWKLWALPSGEIQMNGRGHKAFVSDIAFHPGGEVFVTTSGDRSVKVWNVVKELCLTTLTDHSETVWSADFHQSGSFFATGSTDQTVKIFDSKSLRCRQTLRGHVDAVNSVQFQPFAGNLATGSADKTTSVWDMRTGLCVQTFYGHRNAINHVRFDCKGMYLASADADGVVKVWDLRMVAEVLQIDTGHMPANEVDWDIAGKVLCVASTDSSIKFFDVWQRKFLIALEGHEDSVRLLQSLTVARDAVMNILATVIHSIRCSLYASTTVTLAEIGMIFVTELCGVTMSDDDRCGESTDNWNSDDEPPEEQVNDKMIISRDGSLARTVVRVGKAVDGSDRPGKYDRVCVKFRDVSVSDDNEWVSVDFEVGSCDPRVPSAIDVGVRYMTIGSQCRLESYNAAWRHPYQDEADMLRGKSVAPSKKNNLVLKGPVRTHGQTGKLRFQFMLSPPSASPVLNSTPIGFIVELESLSRCAVLRDDGLLRKWTIKKRDPRMVWKASPKVGDTITIVKDGGAPETRLMRDAYVDRAMESMKIGEVARIEVLVPGHLETVNELELREVYPFNEIKHPRDDAAKLLGKQEMPQAMGLPLSRTLVVEDDSTVTVGIKGHCGDIAHVLRWICGRYIVHPIFDVIVRGMRVGERAEFTVLPEADTAYLSEAKLCVNSAMGVDVLASGTTTEEAVRNWHAAEMSCAIEEKVSLSAFTGPVCEIVLITVGNDHQVDSEGQLGRAALSKDTGNRLLALGALGEAKSEYMRALDSLKMVCTTQSPEFSEGNPLETAVNLNLALVCLKQGHPAAAEGFAKRARELDHTSVKAKYRLALALIEQHKEEDEAMSMLKEIRDTSAEAQALILRLKTEQKMKKRKERELFQSMLK
ncbi:hypothetical protein FOL47_009124 [Perkinsus chesapeaki]|uniref:Uncharacterized protein n=1 Tax=Perkinsus chesapeaki TaxID=330153 RepID=A0A7J6LAA4_PERCH|nr:hypothetical protein FOL47_009124 [Perkinsus chesapeaki]